MPRRGWCCSVLGVGAALALAPPAQATPGVTYGGSSLVGDRLGANSVSIHHRADGSVVARIGTSVECDRKRFWTNLAFRVASPPTAGAFTGSDDYRLTRRSRMTATINGTISPTAVTGTITLAFRDKLASCPPIPARPFTARPRSDPAGASSIPPAGTLRFRLTSQSTGGVLLPVALQVTPNGRRVNALWQATLRCGPRKVRFPLTNFSARARLRPDATFVRKERFVFRFDDGLRYRWRVVFRGRFTTDGARGSLRARMQITQPGKTFYPCSSGRHRWTAAA